MSFTYTGYPADNELDALRFALGDTNSSQHLFEDAELQYIIDTTQPGNQRLAVAFRHAATFLGIKAVKRTLGPQSEDPFTRLKYFKDMADKYEHLASYSGTPPTPEYETDKIFGLNMMANDT